jgi:hypothetical protein
MVRTPVIRLVLFLTFAISLAYSEDGGMAIPQFNDKGELIRPRETDKWTFVGSSIGLSYTVTSTPREGPGLIHNVHTQPEAYREFLATGKFPDKTMFVLTLYKPEQKVSPNQNGYFQGDLVATEVSVKDSARFKEGWAYFNFSGGSSLRESATAEAPGRCHACHKEHGMRDNVFVQFYPALRK